MREGAMMEDAMSNMEIEHKFLVNGQFDRHDWADACRALEPDNEKELRVVDTYYVPPSDETWIYRHRFDAEIQQLTVKSRGGDTQVRTEINLDLNGIDQSSKVAAFLSALHINKNHEVVKQIHVFDFPDCEVVHYTAQCGNRTVSCVEFEAVGAKNIEEALRVLDRYESALGFDSEQRSKINLFDLLVR